MIHSHHVYDPLYKNKDKFIILVTGGRGSGKSFATSTFIERLTFEMGEDTVGHKVSHQILYSRYTMVSAGMSIIPEVMDKIAADGTAKYFARSKSDIVNVMTGSHIMFRGIKTSSGNQTAKLKSIKGLSVFVCDEAEEFVNENDFETIMYSIRQSGLKNLVVIIMNPSDSNHFIYQRYIKDTHKLVDYDGTQVQISTHPNVLHIHTSYLDNLEHLAPNFIEEAKAMKERDPERYGHIFMGRWADVAEGAVFKKWGIVKAFPDYCKKVALAMDFGYTCLSGDTLITTEKGDVPIRDIKEGDMVLTRYGYKRVRSKTEKGKKPIIKSVIVTNKGSFKISATDDHRVYANNQWKKYKHLTNSDELVILSSSMDVCTEGVKIKNTTLVSGMNAECIDTSIFTMPFLSITKEKFLKGVSFITLMETLSIMLHKIYAQLHELNTRIYIKFLKIIDKLIQSFFNLLSSLLPTIKKENESQDNDCNNCDLHASIAGKNLYRQTEDNDIAIQDVTANGKRMRSVTKSNENASFADIHSNVANTKTTRLVQQNSQTTANVLEVKIQEENIEEVYDLEIEGAHEYFANGILVHNCDPTAIVKCGIVDNRLYIQEMCYKTNMLSSDIIKELKKHNEGGSLFVYCDSADPRLIDEIALGGIIIYATQKGAGSIQAGIDKMLTMEMYVTEDSTNLQEELRNYTWDKDKDGNYISTPIDAYNHLLDASRYYVLSVLLGKIMKPKNVTKERLGIF